MVFSSWASRCKDAALEYVAKWLANRYHLKKLGRITNLKLDSTANDIFLVLFHTFLSRMLDPVDGHSRDK